MRQTVLKGFREPEAQPKTGLTRPDTAEAVYTCLALPTKKADIAKSPENKDNGSTSAALLFRGDILFFPALAPNVSMEPTRADQT